MNWYSAGLAGLSGALAALLAGLIVRNSKENGTAYTAVAVALFVAFTALSKTFLLPKINAWRFAEEINTVLLQVPAFETIKKHEPETYNKLVEDLGNLKENGSSRQEGIDRVRQQISKVVIRRLPAASDEAILDYMQVTLDEMKYLNDQSGALCFRFLYTEVEGGVDGSKVFPREIQERDFDALNRVIETSVGSESIVPQESDVLANLETVYREIYHRYGDDARELEDPVNSSLPPSRICDITHSLYTRVMTLPPDESADIFRWMFAQAAGTMA